MKIQSKIYLIIFILSQIVLLGFVLLPQTEKNQQKIIKNPKKEILQKGNYPAEKKGCLASGCHSGIEPIRDHNSKMAKEIYELGKKSGDENGCTVCHNGNANEEKNKRIAHKNMIRFPGSVWVKDQSCGKCHEDHMYSLHRNLMQTEAGKIQGALWGWGAENGYVPKYGNYDIDDPDGKTPLIGSEKYIAYLKKLMEKHPHNFPDKLIKLPEADLSSLEDKPEQAIFTYIRTECQRCHVGVRGAQRRGDYRGMGCASCHIPFGDEGFYEGNDKSIKKNERGHVLVHSIQSSRKTKVHVNGKTYSGIPNETCSSCHNRGKRIGVSYLGMIESPYNTTWNEDGSGQNKLHGKKYAYIKDDVHHNIKSRDGNPVGGLLCQDCHTTIAVHGNGNIGGTTFGEVEVECTDCHGTPDKYPWELSLGYGDEFGIEQDGKARGLSTEILYEEFSKVYPVEDGYLLSSRGNPFGNVVRRKNKVVVHSAGGLDFYSPTLKELNETDKWKNPIKAKTAMIRIKEHLNKMECYSCHSSWAPQCYGCHVKVDYSDKKFSVDWIKTGNSHFPNGETCETKKGEHKKTSPGKASEGRTYIRWEDPVLGINGEGRVSPLIPGCQQITTVIGEDGKTLVSNKIWRTPANMENGGKEGQRGIDMTPTQPHTISAKARECVSCHADPKALGYGIHDGKYMKGYEKDRFADLRTTEGELISKNSLPQFSKIEDLPFDLSQIVTRDGKQVQTVGHHWPLSGPLSQEQRERMERVGICIACHQDIPDGNLSISLLSTAADYLDMKPHSDEEHSKLLNNDINWAALSRIIAPILLFIVLIFFIKYSRKRRKIKYRYRKY